MKIMVLSSHTPSLFWFRMNMMRSFIEYGTEVVAVGNMSEDKWAAQFKKNNIRYKSIPVSRNGLNIFSDIKTFTALKKLIKIERPDKIFVYQAKTIVYGTLAAHIVDKSIEIYPLVAGLGSIFRGEGIKNKLIRKILSIQYKISFRYANAVIFQNNDDLNFCVKLSLVNREKTRIINGSGVDTNFFVKTPLPNDRCILYIGRLIADKGIREYLETCRRLKIKDATIKCMLVGPYDSNPSAITPEELKPYIDGKIIQYFGEQKDVRPFLQKCSVYVLPSYHEGTPKTVLEAMATGRPIVTTDAPGCRETVLNEKNGFLVPVKNIDALENSVWKILSDSELATAMGNESRAIAETKYNVKLVNETIIDIMNL